MARLPVPGQDTGTWGNVLNDFLGQVHQADGSLKPGVVTNASLENSSVTQAKLSANTATNGQVLGSDGTNLVWTTPASGAGDATTTSKGAIQLSGDLGGTAASPTVPGLANKANAVHTHAISDVTSLQATLNAKEATIAAGTTGQYYRGDKSWQTLDKTVVGLGNADNTSDTNKPISTAVQAALNTKASTSSLAAVATTGSYNDLTSKPVIPTVTDATTSDKGIVQLAGDLAGTAAAPTVPGLAGKANTTHTHAISDVTNLQTTLSAKEPILSAGTTSQYYRGDKSWQTLDKAAVGLSNVDNTSDASKPVSTAMQTALNGKADSLYTINAQIGTSYTLVANDGGKFITMTNSSPSTVTVPSNTSVSFTIGTRIAIVQMGSGQVTVVAAGGVSVFGDPGLKIAVQYGGVELVKLATDTWILVGRLAA